MKLLFSPRFLKQYRDAPVQVQKAFEKQAKLLVHNLRQGYVAERTINRPYSSQFKGNKWFRPTLKSLEFEMPGFVVI